MKFADVLSDNLVPEWKDKYLDYKQAKKQIKKIVGSNLTHSITRQGSIPTPSFPGRRFTEFKFKPKQKVDDDQSFSLPPAAFEDEQPNHSTPLLSATSSLEQPKPTIKKRTNIPDGQPESLAAGNDHHDGDAIPLDNADNSNILAFTEWLDDELLKIETFYREYEDKSVERFLLLQDQLHHLNNEKLRLSAKAATHNNDDKFKNGLSKTTHELYKINKYELPSLPQFNFGKKQAVVDVQTRANRKRDYGPHKQQVPYYVAKRQLKSALQEYYRSLELLQSYRMLNRTGFRKLLKKFDKQTNSSLSPSYMEKVNSSYFASSDVLENLIPKVEDLFGKFFEHGNRKVAVEKLRSNIKEDMFYTSNFLSGISYGIALPLLISAMYLGLHKTLNREIPEGKYLLQIWAGFVLLLLISCLFGIVCIIWTKYKVNYVFIFEFNPRTALDYRQYHLIPSILTLAFSLFSWFSFNNFWPDSLNAIYWPWFFFGFGFIVIFLPFDTLYWDTRKWMISVMWRLILSGAYPVEFKDFFTGDIFCSLTYTMGNLSFFFCMYITHWKGAIEGDPVCGSSRSRLLGFFAALPAVWRCLQCLRRYADSGDWFPHLANALKYTITIVYYALLSVYRINMTPANKAVFIFFAILNSIYSSLWDVFMDWSLIQEKNLLRKDLTYPKWFYYFAIVSDVVFRFQWVFYVLFNEQIQQSAVTSFCVAVAEVLRRFIWMIIRVENEHITNIHLYRAAREAPLPYDTIYRSRLNDIEAEGAEIISIEEAPESLTNQSLRKRGTVLASNVLQAIMTAHARDFQRHKSDGAQEHGPVNSSDEENSEDEANGAI